MIEQKAYMPEKFLLGHPSIDIQHELLFVLYHEVLHTLQNAEDGYELAEIFLGLNMYVVNHFQFEEDLMSATDFPGHEAHSKEHRQLKENVGLLHGRFTQAKNKAEEAVVAQEITAFLANWLDHHIAKVDRVLCQFLREQSPG